MDIELPVRAPGPILIRELRASARRRSTYIARILSALSVAGLAIGMMLASLYQALSPAAAGQLFFHWLILAGYSFALFYGMVSTCDCISREKREGTLGLLFLTRLSAFDVVLAKFVPRFSHSLYCLLAAVPSVAFIFLLGGVTLGEFFRAAANLANHLFFFTTLGLLVSALSRNERQVFITGLGLAIVVGVLLPALVAVGNSGGTANVSWLDCFSLGPLGFLVATGLPATVPVSQVMLRALALNHLCAWLFLILAGIVLGRQVRETSAPESLWRQLFCRPVVLRARRSNRKAATSDAWWEVNPIYEAATRFNRRLSAPSARYFIAVLALVGLLIGYPEAWLYPAGWQANRGNGLPDAWFSPPIFPGAVLLLHLLLKFAVAAEACHALSAERRNGSLELLLATPMGEREIVHGQMLALKRRYAPAVMWVLAFQALLLITGIVQLDPMGQLSLIFIFAGASLWLLLDLYALAWMGLWCGHRMVSAARAISQTVLTVLLAPAAFSSAYLTVVLLVFQYWQWNRDYQFPFLVLAPAIFLAVYVGTICWPAYCLQERLRHIAAQPFGRKR